LAKAEGQGTANQRLEGIVEMMTEQQLMMEFVAEHPELVKSAVRKAVEGYIERTLSARAPGLELVIQAVVTEMAQKWAAEEFAGGFGYDEEQGFHLRGRLQVIAEWSAGQEIAKQLKALNDNFVKFEKALDKLREDTCDDDANWWKRGERPE